MEAGIKRPTAIIIGVAIVAVFGFLAIWGLAPGDTPNVAEGLHEIESPEEIAAFVEMSHLGILTSTNYLGHRVYTVQANLKNISDTPIRFIEVKMTFLDSGKQILKEEVHPAFQVTRSPLEPGTEFRFEIAFENPPRDWNYHVPDTAVMRVAY